MLENLTHDQLALLGCAGALLFTGGLMYFSFWIGRGRRERSVRQPVSTPQTWRTGRQQQSKNKAA